MVKPYIFALMALCAGLSSAASTPAADTEVSSAEAFNPEGLPIVDEDELGEFFEDAISNDLPEPEDVYGPFGPDDDRWDDDEQEDLDDAEGVTASNSTSGLVARSNDHFRLFRRTGSDHNEVRIHTNCNHGGCNGELFVVYNEQKNLCNQKFNVCGRDYRIKHTGKRPGCSRMKYIDKVNHGERYGKLIRNGQTRAICYFDRSKNYHSIKCNGNFKSLVKCVWN